MLFELAPHVKADFYAQSLPNHQPHKLRLNRRMLYLYREELRYRKNIFRKCRECGILAMKVHENG